MDAGDKISHFLEEFEAISAPVARNLLFIYFFYFLFVPFLEFLPFEIFEVALFSAAIVLTLPVYLKGAPFKSRGPQISNRQLWSILGSVIIIAAALRLYNLGGPSLWFDEAITSNAAEAVLRTGEPVFPSGFVYDRALPHSYVVAASFELFGVSEFAGRLPSVVFGLLTVLALYLLGREVGDGRVGLVAAVLAGLAAWEVAWTRQVRMYPMLQLFFVTGFLLLFRSHSGGRWRFGYVASFVAVSVLASQVHVQGYLLFPAGLLFFAVKLSEEVLEGRRMGRLQVAAVSALSILFVLGLLRILPRLGLKSGGALDVAMTFYRNVVPSFLGPLVILSVPGAVISCSGSRKVENFLTVATVLAGVGVMLFSIEKVAARYLFFLAPIFFLWTSFTIIYVSERVGIRGAFSAEDAPVDLFVMAGVIAVLLASPYLSVVPQQDYDLGPNSPTPGFKNAYSYVSQHSGTDDVLVAGWTAPALFYHGEVDYWSVFSYSGRDVSIYEGRDLYGGGELLRDSDDFQAMMKEEASGWVVLNGRAWRRQPGDVKRFIEENMDRHEVSGFDGRVYSWGR